MNITIGSLIRNREWILPLFLEHILKIDYDKKLITLHFIINNSIDQSQHILEQFKSEHDSSYRIIKIETIDNPDLGMDYLKEKFKMLYKSSYDIFLKNSPKKIKGSKALDKFIALNNKKFEYFKSKINIDKDIRSKDARNGFIYSHLAELRNRLFNSCIDNLINIDSDILVQPDIISKLIAHKKDMISSYIFNGYEYSLVHPEHKYFNFTNCCENTMVCKVFGETVMKKPGHKPLKKSNIRLAFKNNINPLEVGLTGAVCFYSNKLIRDTRVRFGYHDQGEDHYYCLEAQRCGYKIFTDTNCYSQHIMSEYWLEKYLSGEKVD